MRSGISFGDKVWDSVSWELEMETARRNSRSVSEVVTDRCKGAD